MYLKIRVKYAVLTIFLSISYYCNAQFLRTPEEMEDIVMNTPEKYMLQETNNLEAKAFANCRLAGQSTEKSTGTPKNSVLSSKVISKSNSKKLKKRIKKILKNKTQASAAVDLKELTYNYFALGKYDEALLHHFHQESSNDFTFENEYFLARAYLETKKPEFACKHIFNAKVLLPYSKYHYSPEEIQTLEKYFDLTLQANKKIHAKWEMQFSYCIAKREDKTFISFKSQPWRTYAICKSVWQEDDQHKSKMSTISDQPSWLVEEKECLLNALVSYLRHEENNPQFHGLKELSKALDSNYVNDFIHYEAYVSRYLPTPEGQPNSEKIAQLESYFIRAHTSARK